MNKKDTWNNFYRTGKIEDYIKYSQASGRLPMAKSHISANSIQNSLQLHSQQLHGDLQLQQEDFSDKDRGIDNQGAGSGRERPFGNGFNS